MLPQSDKKLYFVGLYLLYLLSNNRNTDYFFELEFLQLTDFDNKFISLAVEVEHCISEGNYNKLFKIRESMNDGHYDKFLNKLGSSIRYQIAKSIERSYDSISIAKCLDLLSINQGELSDFIQQVKNSSGNDEIEWIADNQRIVFRKDNKDKNTIPAEFIVQKTVKLANELEKIV